MAEPKLIKMFGCRTRVTFGHYTVPFAFSQRGACTSSGLPAFTRSCHGAIRSLCRPHPQLAVAESGVSADAQKPVPCGLNRLIARVPDGLAVIDRLEPVCVAAIDESLFAPAQALRGTRRAVIERVPPPRDRLVVRARVLARQDVRRDQLEDVVVGVVKSRLRLLIRPRSASSSWFGYRRPWCSSS